jgi:hypothetical protein
MTFKSIQLLSGKRHKGAHLTVVKISYVSQTEHKSKDNIAPFLLDR